MRKKIRTKAEKQKKPLFVKKDAVLLSVVLSISLFLNVLGFGWGMDGYVPWMPDAIEGITTVREMPRLLGEWTYKYPRLQFAIDGMCYKPFIDHWENNKVFTQVNGQTRGYAITPKRLNTLAAVSRVNILVMSGLIIFFLYAAAKFYYADSIAAFAASLSLALSFVFVHYSHTTCVDIPSMLWITAGVYFLLRSVVLNTLWDHIAMAVMLAFAACTKDAMLFYVAAFVLSYLVLRVERLYAQSQNIRSSLLSVVNRNTLLAVVIFCVLFALIQNIIPFPKAYWERMGVWSIGGRGVADFNKGFTGQIALLTATLKNFYWAMGWPLILMVLISLCVTSKKHFLFNLMVVVFPLVFFYLLVSMRIKMSYIRYYLPVMGLLYLPVGHFVGQLVARHKQAYARILLAGFGLSGVLSASLCLALDIEMIRDSRIQTARWFTEHVPQNTLVLSCIRRPYGPKLQKAGYPMIENWTVPPLEELLAHQSQLPDYIVLSDNWLTIQTPQAQDFRNALLKNQTAYSLAATFRRGDLLNPQKSFFSIASWPLKGGENLSPDIFVMKKTSSN